MYGYDDEPEYATRLIDYLDGTYSRDRYREVNLVTTAGTRLYYENEVTGVLTHDIAAYEEITKGL